MSSSASTAVAPSASLAFGNDSTKAVSVPPSQSISHMLTSVRTQDASSGPGRVSPSSTQVYSSSLMLTPRRTQASSSVSTSSTQTSSVSPSSIQLSFSTSVSPAGKLPTNLITPTSSSLGVKASESPGKFLL